jgi:apolipoprotein N-acyltransferase
MESMPAQSLQTERKHRLIQWSAALGCALLSGTWLAWSLPPFNLYPLAFFALVPLFLAFTVAKLPEVLLLALLTTLTCAFWLLGTLTDAQGVSGFLMFGASLFLIGGFITTFKRLDRLSNVLAVGAIGVLAEWLATLPAMPFHLALTQWKSLPFLQLATITGVWGLSFMLWASSAALAGALQVKQITLPLKSIILSLILIHIGGGLVYTFGAREGSPVRLAAIQPVDTWSAPMIKRKSDQAGRSSKSAPEQLCEQAVRRGAQLLVLPEAYMQPEEGQRLATELQVYVVHGFLENRRNGAILFRPGGIEAGVHYKTHPYGSEAELIVRGDRADAYDTPLASIGMLVCFDNMFTDVTRSLVRQGAQIVLQPNLDPHVSNMMIHHIHAAMTPIRAVENRVPFVRADWEGCSQIVDAYGKVVAQAPTNEPFVLVESLRLQEGGTFFTRWGDYFVWLCAIQLGVVLLRARKTG